MTNEDWRFISAPAHDEDEEGFQSAPCRAFQFLAVRITDVTKLPKATTRAPNINFQEIP